MSNKCSRLYVNVFKQKRQEVLGRKIILDWQHEIDDDNKHPILKTKYLNRNPNLHRTLT